MKNDWFITGDIHGSISRLWHIKQNNLIPKDSNLIVLGDFGANFYLNDKDNHFKNVCEKLNITFYAVRGNHEQRPELINGMELVYDELVKGDVYFQPKWPHIKYFKNWGIYQINNYKIAIIGGAYSIDKYYRLEKGWTWFSAEQLTIEERKQCKQELQNQKVDFVFTHTAPRSFEPIDLFIPIVDQSTVDKSMEDFLEEIKNCLNWKIWLFGHYHHDRIEINCVEQFYQNIENIEEIWQRWN